MTHREQAVHPALRSSDSDVLQVVESGERPGLCSIGGSMMTMNTHWVKIPQALDGQPLFVRGPAVVGLLAYAYAYAAEHMTDGLVPAMLLGPYPKELASLKELGEVAEEGESFRLVRFLEFNATKEQREAQREKVRKRVARHRCNTVTDPVTNGVSNPPCNATVRSQDSGNKSQKATTPTESTPASPKRKTPKKTGEPSPQAKCWSHFKSRYETDHRSAGKSPTPSKHLFIQLARLAKAHSEAEVRSRIDNYFEHPPWKHREGPRVLGTLIAQFDSFAAPVNGTASHPSMDSSNWKDTEVPK